MSSESHHRTLKDVSFETFSTAKKVLLEKADDPDAGEERYEDAVNELVSKWNDATQEARNDE